MKFEERYKLESPIAQDVRVTLWSGRDSKLARKVLVAIVGRDAPAPLRERFAAQTEKLVSIRHASLLRVLDAGSTEDGGRFACMEPWDGESLDARMARSPAMRADHVVRMIADLCAGLAAMHAAGVAHGDLHPGNVLVKEMGGRITPKLVGFGANAADERGGSEAPDPARLGALAYMSPAQARREVIADAASDVYSAAAILFSLLSGRLPHRGADAEALRAAVSESAVPYLGDVRPELAGPIADVLAKALSPNASERFEDADALAKALRAALIRTRDPGALATVVGPRTLEPDATDADLAKKRMAATVPAQHAPMASRAGAPPEAPTRTPFAPKQRPAPKVPAAPPGAAAKPKDAPPATAAVADAPPSAKGIPAPAPVAKPKEVPAGPASVASAASSSAKEVPAPGPAAKSKEAPPATAPTAKPAGVVGAADTSGTEPPPTSAPPGAGAAPEDALEFERLSGLLVVEPPAAAPPPPLPEAKQPATPEDALEFEQISGLLEISQVEPPALPAPPPQRTGDAAVAVERGDVVPAATVAAAASAPPSATVPASAAEQVRPSSPSRPVSSSPSARATVPAPPAPPPGSAQRAPSRTSPASVETVAEPEADAGRGGGVPPWVWAAVGVAAAAAVVVAIVTFVMPGDEKTEALTRAERASLDAVEPPTVPESPAADVRAEDGTAATTDAAVVELGAQATSSAAPTDAGSAAAADAGVPAADAGAPDQAQAQIVLTLTGVPEGATVTLDGEQVAGTEIALAPSDAERTLEVRLEGHETWTRTVRGDVSAEIQVELRAEREERPRARSRRAQRARERAARAESSRGRDRNARREESSRARRDGQRRASPRAERAPERPAPSRPPGSRPSAVRDPGF